MKMNFPKSAMLIFALLATCMAASAQDEDTLNINADKDYTEVFDSLFC